MTRPPRPLRADTADAPTAESAADASEGDLDTAGLSASVAAQLEYVHAHWDDTESDRFGVIDENDCVNFASQSLLARGWEVDDEWWYDEDGDAYASSDAWISSTMLRWYLEDHPERATALTDDQRDQVKVGDLVQFDWDDSGDRDHTGIVTAVTTEADGRSPSSTRVTRMPRGTARSTGRSPSTTPAAWRTTGASPSSRGRASQARLRYWFENAASNDAVGRGQMSERMNPTASAAPCRRSMPASSHSTEMGPV